MKRVIVLLSISILIFLSAKAEERSSLLQFHGQIVGYASLRVDTPAIFQPGFRFVPVLTGKFPTQHHSFFDFETSFNFNTQISYHNWKYSDDSAQARPYRIWLRYAQPQWEIRGGLQKINFGQSRIFRPLMWFDKMDVRDPIQLTEGVNALLGKYFFSNNANLWVWGLLGNKDPKGWEFYGGELWRPEVGGRFEFPFIKGELAVSTHFRKMKAMNLITFNNPNDFQLLGEKRIGLDGKWDIGPGLWIEHATTVVDTNSIMIPRFQDLSAVGMDYTFPLANGLGVTLEYLRIHSGFSFLFGDTEMHMISMMLNYPISILDNISAMFFYIPSKNVFYNYFNWGRTYDHLSVYLMCFLNPDTPLSIMGQGKNANQLFSGKGIQLMVNYNF